MLIQASSSETAFFSHLRRTLLYEIPFLSGTITCTVIGCYKVFVDFDDPGSTYELEANSCFFPLLTISPVITSHTTSATAPVISTITPSSHLTSATAPLISTSRPRASTTLMTSQQTTALTMPSPPLGVDEQEEVMILFICPLLVILIVIFTMLCAIICLRRRKVTK